MNDKQIKDILKVVAHFRGKPITENVLTEYCKLNKMFAEDGQNPAFTVGVVEDYTEQVAHDEIMQKVFAEILVAIGKMKYTPVFITEKESNEIKNANDEVRVEITKILENNGVKYRYATNSMGEVAQTISSVIEQAGTTAFNRALDVMMRITKDYFGSDLNMKQVRDYIDGVVEKMKEKKAD